MSSPLESSLITRPADTDDGRDDGRDDAAKAAAATVAMASKPPPRGGTGRERRDLDAAIVQAVAELVQPNAVRIARLVSTPLGDRWWTSAQWHKGEVVATSEAEPSDPAVLIPALAHPGRAQALLSAQPVTDMAAWDAVDEPLASRGAGSFAGAGLPAPMGLGTVTTLELVCETHGPAVLEVESATAATTQDLRLITSALRTYRLTDALIAHPHRDRTSGLLDKRALEEGFEHQGLFKTAAPNFLDDERNDASYGFVSAGDMDRRGAVKPTYWMGLIDIDHLHEVNRLGGHLAGDQVLATTARMLQSVFRHRDRFYRPAADEFAVVLRCPSARDAFSAFERFKKRFAGFVFPGVGFLTCSVGLTQVRSADSASSAISRAYLALAEAKQGGRNCIVCLDGALSST